MRIYPSPSPPQLIHYFCTVRLPLQPQLTPPPHPRCEFVPQSLISSSLTVHRLPAKRKASEEPDDSQDGVPSSSSSKDFEAGRVTCEACGESVSYRDESTGAFTTKHWDAHKLGWWVHVLSLLVPFRIRSFLSFSSTAPCSAPPPEPAQSHAPPTGPSTETVSAGPPSKRRRAKRSEEERIQYLRSDPYVAQFEPYRVLCASCDKWIRLRPNSTYCSIPWDAHRKSCLARKGCVAVIPCYLIILNPSLPTYSVKDPPPPFIAGDPDARKYDGERVLCKVCKGWILVGHEDQAAQAWSQHRAQCRPASPSTPAVASAIPRCAFPSLLPEFVLTLPPFPQLVTSVPPPSQRQMALVSALPPPASRAIKEKDHPPSPLTSSSPQPPPVPQRSDTPSSTPGPGAVSESRRRNAEQRAAQLRADPLLAQVEPHRVFCALCRKWVQLRQDSTFCAYPWQQHRSKCVIRQSVASIFFFIRTRTSVLNIPPPLFFFFLSPIVL